MFSKILRFGQTDAGSITTDWVFLVASIVAICLMAAGSGASGATSVADNAGSSIGVMETGGNQ